jgi:hypothetical protein
MMLDSAVHSVARKSPKTYSMTSGLQPPRSRDRFLRAAARMATSYCGLNGPLRTTFTRWPSQGFRVGSSSTRRRR